MSRKSQLSLIAVGLLLASGSARGAIYTEDFEIAGSQPFGTSDARSPSEVGWTAFSDTGTGNFEDRVNDNDPGHSNGNSLAIANRKYNSRLDFTTRYAYIEHDVASGNVASTDYKESLWYTGEPLASQPLGATMNLNGATAGLEMEGGGGDSGNGSNGGRGSIVIQLAGGNWYVSNKQVASSGTDGINTLTLAIDTTTLWDSLVVDGAATPPGRIAYTDGNATLTSGQLSTVVAVGFYTQGVANDGSGDLPMAIDNYSISGFEVLVPEPASLGLFGLAGLLGLRRRR